MSTKGQKLPVGLKHTARRQTLPETGRPLSGMKQGWEQRVQGRLKGQLGREGQWGCRAVLDQRSSGGARRLHTLTCLTIVTDSCPHCLDVNQAQPWQHVHGNLKGLR